MEIEQELQSLRSCLASASDELRNGQHEVSEASTSGKGNEDRLVPTLSNFLGSVSNDFIDVERKFAEMNKKVIYILHTLPLIWLLQAITQFG